MQPLIIYESRCPAALTAILAALAAFVDLRHAFLDGPSLAWLSGGFLLALAALPLGSLAIKRLDVVIDEHGVWDRLSCTQRIPWRDIEAVQLVGGDVAIRVRNEQRYISAYQRLICGTEIVLRTHLLGREPGAAPEEFRRKIAEGVFLQAVRDLHISPSTHQSQYLSRERRSE